MSEENVLEVDIEFEEGMILMCRNDPDHVCTCDGQQCDLDTANWTWLIT